METGIFKLNLIAFMILVHKYRLSNLCPTFSGDHLEERGQSFKNLMKCLFHVSEGEITKLIREGLFILAQLARVVGGHPPPEVPDDAAARLRLGGGGQPVGGGGGQQLILPQVDVLHEDVDGGHHQEGGHGSHETFQHVGYLLLRGGQGEFRDLAGQRDDKGHHLKLGEAETSFPGPRRDLGEGGQKGSHLDVVISTEEGEERWKKPSFHEYRKQQEVDSLDR